MSYTRKFVSNVSARGHAGLLILDTVVEIHGPQQIDHVNYQDSMYSWRESEIEQLNWGPDAVAHHQKLPKFFPQLLPDFFRLF